MDFAHAAGEVLGKITSGGQTSCFRVQGEVTVLAGSQLSANINVCAQLLAENFSGFAKLCINQVPETVA